MKQPTLICFLLLLSHTLPQSLTAEIRISPVVDDRIYTYIVHVLQPEGTEFLGAEERVAWHRSFLPNRTLDSGEPRLVYSYREAISGFAARLTPEEAKTMESMDGFLYARPENVLVGQTTYTPDFLSLTQREGLWHNASGGYGMIIGVVDTGVTPSHPSFNGDSMPPPPRRWRAVCNLGPPGCNNKLIGAVAFRSGQSPSPVDDHGHGTHTASTAAGSTVYDAHVLGHARGVASGMAPGAHLSIYKVLFNNRGPESDFLAGIDKAVDDGVDVLSMSLGKNGGEPLFQSSIAITSFKAITKGIFPCACAMNEGPSPSVIANDAPWCLTVGASTTDRRISATVVLGNGMEIDGESAYQPTTFNKAKFLPLVFPGLRGTNAAANCLAGSLPPEVKNSIVLCMTGAISNTDKGENVKAAGGLAMILANQQPIGFTTFADPHSIPASHVSFSDARKIVSYYQTTRNPIATVEFKGTHLGARPTPAVASFSGRGPSMYNGGIIKPDIIAPGVNIIAAWPKEVGPNPTGTSNSTFNFESGTSMATPHISGIAAMLKRNHPAWTPAMIKSALMTTAYTTDSEGNRITDQHTGGPATFFAMGAGHVDTAKANDPGLVYNLKPVDYIPYLCGLYSVDTNRIVSMIVQQWIDCSRYRKISAAQLNYPSIAVALGPSSSTVLERRVTNVGAPSSIYTLMVVEPYGVAVNVHPATLNFSSEYEENSFLVQLTNRNSRSRSGDVAEGYLTWVSTDHVVRSPISVTFT